MAGDVTIGELARRSGLQPATLRMWESRHGFPHAVRSPGGQRRYSADAVAVVRDVVARRDAGLSLAAAIGQAQAMGEQVLPSLFAVLRRAQPELPGHTLPKRALVQLSRAIEDEYCARAEPAIVVGAFQRERHYRQSAPRWRELARTARSAVVLAEFPHRTRSRRAARPIEVPLDADSPALREWAVVVHGPRFCVGLTAWELPGQRADPDGSRVFEAIWSTEPSATRALVTAAAAIAGGAVGDDLRRARDEIDTGFPPPEPEAATALAHRMIGYLGRCMSDGTAG